MVGECVNSAAYNVIKRGDAVDSLLESALNAAALRPDVEPTCANHPGHYAPREHDGKRLCWTCWTALGIPEKQHLPVADQAAWERDQNGRYDDIHHNDRKWRQTFPEPKYVIKR